MTKFTRATAVAATLVGSLTASTILTEKSAIAQQSSDSSRVYATAESAGFFARSGCMSVPGGAFNPGATVWNGGGFTSNVVNGINTLRILSNLT